MSVLGKKQRKFARDFAILILIAYALGYEVTLPPEHENHIKSSLHFTGLARDINLFKDGKYLTKTEDYEPLGLIWEAMGNTWGGRFTRRGKPYPDGNHFSIAHRGTK